MLEGGRPRNERVGYEDQQERAWERDPEDSGDPDGDAPTVPHEERGDGGGADLGEAGESGGVTDEETISPVPEEPALRSRTGMRRLERRREEGNRSGRRWARKKGRRKQQRLRLPRLWK